MLSIVPALALLVTSVAAHPLTAKNVARHRQIGRDFVGWDGVSGYDLESDKGYLEAYETYSARYAAIGCTGKHGTPFFESCCHPLLATETLAEHRPAECNAPASAAPVEAAPTPAPAEPVLITAPEEDDDEELEECDEDEETVEEEEPVVAAPPAASPAPSPEATTTAKAEEPSSSSAAEPSPEPSPEPTPTSSAAAEPTPSPEPPKEEPPKDEGNNNGGGNTFDGGRVTWYEQNGNPGHCGEFHADSDLIAAMNTKQFFDLDVCGKNIELKGNGNSVVVKVVDSCPGCHENSVDLSVGAFKALGGLDLGVIDVSWKFV